MILLDKVLTLVGSPRGYLNQTDDVVGLVKKDTAKLVGLGDRPLLVMDDDQYFYMSDVLDLANGILTSQVYTLMRFLVTTQFDSDKPRSFNNALINNIPNTFTVDKEMVSRLLRPKKVINKQFNTEKGLNP